MLWVTFKDEFVVKALFRRLAELGNSNIRLLKYIPPWAYERNKELEILTRHARMRDPLLRTQIRLGTSDLILRVKRKGDIYYKEISNSTFGPLPSLNFIARQEVSPGEPRGRRRHSSDDSVRAGSKRKRKSNSSKESVTQLRTKNRNNSPNINETSGSRHYRPAPSSAYAIHLVYWH